MKYVSLATTGVGAADVLSGGKVLGTLGSRAFGIASLFPTMVDLASDYSGRSHPVTYLTTPKKK